MKFTKIKLFVIIFAGVFIFFFANDFGLIDIEKTAIITAIGVDLSENDEYSVTALVAVPEAGKNNTESSNARLTGSGATVGSAIKKIGDETGWFPQLSFCNLIVLGKNFDGTNIVKALDYFAKTLRVQDSALVVISDTDAKEVLSASTPLDKTASFALQKLLLKTPGFNRDVASVDIRKFCIGYYSLSKSSHLPIVSVEKTENADGTEDASESDGGKSQGQSGEKENQKSDGENKFSASRTALFLDGKRVGELSPDETLIYNALFDNFSNTTIQLKGVKTGLDDGKNYLLTVLKCTPNISLSVNGDGLFLDISLSMYCKISDLNAENSDDNFTKNTPLPQEVKLFAEEKVTNGILSLTEKEKNTGCDIFLVKERLYKYCHKNFAEYKDKAISAFIPRVKVTVSGQK